MNDALGGFPTTCAGQVYLAELLVSSFEMQGWPLSDLASGHVLAFVPSETTIKADEKMGVRGRSGDDPATPMP